jgi:hypothetical protein
MTLRQEQRQRFNISQRGPKSCHFPVQVDNFLSDIDYWAEQKLSISGPTALSTYHSILKPDVSVLLSQ